MAFDGVTIAALRAELSEKLEGGRLTKIAQPEETALLLTIKSYSGQYRLLLSADASLPLVYLSGSNQASPLTAPNFCMLLRKHISGGRIVSISQPGLERVLSFQIEHLDEMGDLCHKKLIIELMGKHSNIIFCDDEDRIIDSIKHVSAAVSSVREVLPGRDYFIPQTTDKSDPLEIGREEFMDHCMGKPVPVFKAIYTTLTGISPILAQELCYRAGVDGEASTSALSIEEKSRIYQEFTELVDTIKEGSFTPTIAYEGRRPVEYSATSLRIYDFPGNTLRKVDSMSTLLEEYYREKNQQTRIRQRSADLRHIVQTTLERTIKKYDLQLQQMEDTQKRDTYRIYGELLNTYGYSAPQGAASITVDNYYTGEKLTIPLDNTLSATENAKRYFDRYGKLKRTYEALSTLTLEVKDEITHLESIQASLDIALTEEDLVEIREELVQSGYLRKHSGGKKVKVTSKPFHYISSDGYDIYIGKNNFQNDELTFRFANGGDWWFHAKKMPGSHVILRAKGTEEIPDRAFEEAAKLAAYYSKGRDQEKVEIDYVRKKEVKKPSGAKPGFVVYYTNYSMAVSSDISGLTMA